MTDLPVLNRSFVLTAAEPVGKRWSPACRQRACGFTLLELLTVIAIVVVLAGLILGGMGYAQQKAASSRATGEIAALSNLIEAFKADFGDYPRSDDAAHKTSTAPPKTVPDARFSAFLAVHLFGRQVTPATNITHITNWARKNNWAESGLGPADPPVEVKVVGDNGTVVTVGSRSLVDPFGNPYGYSTGGTYNPTFDLWSTAGATPSPASESVDSLSQRWIKNW